MTSYRLTPTGPSMAADGFALFRDAYLRARRANPLLPALTQGHEARLRRRVERAFARGGGRGSRGASGGGRRGVRGPRWGRMAGVPDRRPVPGGHGGALLGETATAQVRSAFVVPAARRGGIGGALLQQAVAWTRDAGFERLFVEHETANLPGAAFWRRHFEPYLVFSMRYVDRTA